MTDLKFKPGDHVMVPMKVTEADGHPPGSYCLELSSGRTIWLPEDALASATLIERPLAVGDRVIAAGATPVIILALDGEEAWVKVVNGSRFTISLSELRRAEPAS